MLRFCQLNNMILLHRITPFFIGLITAVVFFFITQQGLAPVQSSIVLVVCVSILLSRLLEWKVNTFQFWNFFGTPILFLISCVGMVFLLEQYFLIITIAVFSTFLLTLFVEYVFQYTHLPSSYQPYSLEYMTMLLNVLTIFFLASSGFGIHLLIQTSLVVLAIIFFFLSFFLVHGALWVSKVSESTIKPFALSGAILLTEFFVILNYLPTGFYTNAAFVTLFFYLFVGLTRAHVLHKLSRSVIKRYLITATVLLFVIIVSSKWV